MTTTVFDQTTALTGTDDGNGNGNLNLRQNIFSALLSAATGTQARVTVRFGTAEGSESPAISDMFIGQAAAAGHNYDFNGNQVRLTFSGGNTVNGSAAGVVTSDWVTLGEAYDNTKNYVISYHVQNGASCNLATATLTNATTYFDGGGASNAGTTVVTLANSVAANVSFIQTIEIQAAGTAGPALGGSAEVFAPQLGPDWRPLNFRPRLAYQATSVSGALATTENADTAAFTLTFDDQGALAATEGVDTAAFVGSFAGLSSSAELFSPQLGPEWRPLNFRPRLAYSLNTPTGPFSVTEAADTAAFTLTFDDQGALTTTESADTAAFTLTFDDQGILTATEGVDTAAFTLTFADQGSLAATEGADTASFALAFDTEGALAATETPDVAAFAGTFAGVTTGAFAVTEPPDVAAATLTFVALPVIDTGNYGGRRRIDWEGARTKRERLEDAKRERELAEQKVEFKKKLEAAIRPPAVEKPPEPKAAVKPKPAPRAERDTSELEIAKLQATAAKARVVAAEISAKGNVAETRQKAKSAETARVKAAQVEAARVKVIEDKRRAQRAYDDALAMVLLSL